MKTWLWPDRTIGRKESGALRDEHNRAVTLAEDLALSVESLLAIATGELRDNVAAQDIDEAETTIIERAKSLLKKIEA